MLAPLSGAAGGEELGASDADAATITPRGLPMRSIAGAGSDIGAEVFGPPTRNSSFAMSNRAFCCSVSAGWRRFLVGNSMSLSSGCPPPLGVTNTGFSMSLLPEPINVSLFSVYGVVDKGATWSCFAGQRPSMLQVTSS